jgi:hypothetical protein
MSDLSMGENHAQQNDQDGLDQDGAVGNRAQSWELVIIRASHGRRIWHDRAQGDQETREQQQVITPQIIPGQNGGQAVHAKGLEG